MSTVTQSITYPVVGETVEIMVTGLTSGTRARCRVMSVPVGSEIPVYAAQEEEWVKVSRSGGDSSSHSFGPIDMHGIYELEVVTETLVTHIPHYSNDGSTTSNPIEEWEETSHADLTIYAGRKVARQLGITPNTCTLEMHCVATSASAGDQGVISSYFDEDRCPKLLAPSSDIAKVAVGAPMVMEKLASIGGDGYWSDSNVIPKATVFYDPTGLLVVIAGLYNDHRNDVNNGIHDLSDAALAVDVTAITTLATLKARINTLKANFNTHLGHGAGVAHPNGADVNTVALADCTTLDNAITLMNNIRTKYDQHRVRHTVGHYVPGDAKITSRTTARTSYDFDSAVALYLDVGGCFNSHVAEVFSVADYHANADNDNDAVECETQAVSEKEFCIRVNRFAEWLNAHCNNIKWSDKSSASYHTIPDVGIGLDSAPRAADWVSGVALLDVCIWTFMHHLDYGTWHSKNNGGDWFPSTLTYGTELSIEFMKACVAPDLGAPEGSLEIIDQVISWGGFRFA